MLNKALYVFLCHFVGLCIVLKQAIHLNNMTIQHTTVNKTQNLSVHKAQTHIQQL